MAAIDDLKAVWTARANALTDDACKAEALMYLDDWYNAKAAHAAMVSGKISSYSIAGRSVSRRNAGELLALSDSALSRLMACVYGGFHRVDMSQVARTDLPISGV